MIDKCNVVPNDGEVAAPLPGGTAAPTPAAKVAPCCLRVATRLLFST